MIILKIILFILLAVLGIIILLLLLPIEVEFSFIDGKLKYMLKYARLNIMDSEGRGIVSGDSSPAAGRSRSGKVKKSKAFHADKPYKKMSAKPSTPTGKSPEAERKRKPTAADETVRKIQEACSEDEKSSSLGEKAALLIEIWKSAKHPLRKLLKGFHFTDIYIDFLVADEDAYNCAIKYGRVCTLLYNILAQMNILFNAKTKTVDVVCGFGKDESRWDAGGKVRFLPITAVIAGVWFLITYIFRIYLPDRKKEKALHKRRKSCRKAECEV